MANNRLYLRCRGCGKQFFLGKRLSGGYWASEYHAYNGVPMTDRLNNFYDEHECCSGSGPDCFELAYEFTPAGHSLLDKLRALPDQVIACALVYAYSLCKYGVDVSKEWRTVTVQKEALDRAYTQGRIDQAVKIGGDAP